MAYLSNATRRGANLYRIRFTLTLPDGKELVKSREIRKKAEARSFYQLATVVEDKSAKREADKNDLNEWLRLRIISKTDAALFTAANSADKELSAACLEYEETLTCCAKEKQAISCRLKNIERIMGGNKAIDSFSEYDGELFKVRMRADGYKTKGINKHLVDLRNIFRQQYKMRALPSFIFMDLKNLKPVKGEKKLIYCFTMEEVIEVLRLARIRDQGALKKEVRLSKNDAIYEAPLLGGNLFYFLLLGFGTGIRREELTKLTWSEINWNKRTLTVPAAIAKDGDERVVGLGGKLFVDLKSRFIKKGKRETLRILPPYHLDSISQAVKKHFIYCGFGSASFHSMRHTYTTWLQKVGASSIETRGRTGHNDDAILAHYTHTELAIETIYEDRFSFLAIEEQNKGGAGHVRS